MRSTLQKVWMLMIMLCASISVFAYDFEVNGDLFFEIISTAELTCKLDSVNENYEGTLIIPEKVSFKGRDLTVTSIGTGCIKACTKLATIKIPNTVTDLGNGCFSECVSLQSADLSQLSSSELASDIFRNCCSLTNVNFPASVNYLPSNFFYGCTSLSIFEIPTWITRINSGCFYGCTSLTDIHVPEGVEYIEAESFSNCGIISISLPTTILSLGENAFNNVNLNSALILPDGLKSIGTGCFYRASIPQITIPSSVESIGRSCFAYTKTQSIIFDGESAIVDLGYGMFESSEVEAVKLPSNLEIIGASCFSNCVNLSKIEFPESMKEFSNNSFANTKMETLSIPVSLNYMPEWCYGGNFCEFATIKHLIWNATNINEAAYNKYLSLSPESSDITWAGSALETRSCYLGPIDTFEISETCKFLSLGFFAESDNLYSGPLFKYSGIRKLIIDDGDDPLTLGSIYSTGNRRTYKLYNYFPDDNNCKYFKKYWMESVVDLFIGRQIYGNPLYTPNLERLSIGNVEKVDIEGCPLPKLKIIECVSENPPSINENHFSKEQYLDLLVVVPDEAIENYRNAETWKNFWNLTSKSDYEAGMVKVSADVKTEIARYDLLGNIVNQNYHGIVIIQFSDGSSKKMIIK